MPILPPSTSSASRSGGIEVSQKPAADERRYNPACKSDRLAPGLGHGDQAAFDALVPLVHDELRRIARRHMNHERPGHTLQATALVNEAFMRLVDIKRIQWQNRAHFFAMASRAMRRILVDSARARNYQKRGAGAQRVSFDEALLVTDEPGQDLVALDDALQALAQIDVRKSQVVEMRFFGGLSVEETAEALFRRRRAGPHPSRSRRGWRSAPGGIG